MGSLTCTKTPLANVQAKPNDQQRWRSREATPRPRRVGIFNGTMSPIVPPGDGVKIQQSYDDLNAGSNFDPVSKFPRSPRSGLARIRLEGPNVVGETKYLRWLDSSASVWLHNLPQQRQWIRYCCSNLHAHLHK